VNKTKTKAKEQFVQEPEAPEEYPMVPPEVHFLADRYVVKVPLSDPHFSSPWELRVHVARLLQRHLGDEVELTSIKVKKPRLIGKTKAKLLKQELCAKAIVTVNF
jgi:hypothetical protein